MICEIAKGLMAGAWSDELTRDEEVKLREHLSGCAECSAEMTEFGATWERLGDMPVPEPSQAMTERWEATLDALLSASAPRPKLHLRQQPIWKMTIAAGLLLAGVLTGALVGSHWQRGGSSDEEIARLRQEIAGTRTMVAVSLLQQQSAVERLRGVSYTQSLPSMAPDVVAALVQAVNGDPNVNVRLAAIDALSKSSVDLADSLGQQQSPMVQAALIDYMIDSRNPAAAAPLRKFAGRPDLNPEVRERAVNAVDRLSGVYK